MIWKMILIASFKCGKLISTLPLSSPLSWIDRLRNVAADSHGRVVAGADLRLTRRRGVAERRRLEAQQHVRRGAKGPCNATHFV